MIILPLCMFCLLMFNGCLHMPWTYGLNVISWVLQISHKDWILTYVAFFSHVLVLPLNWGLVLHAGHRDKTPWFLTTGPFLCRQDVDDWYEFLHPVSLLQCRCLRQSAECHLSHLMQTGFVLASLVCWCYHKPYVAVAGEHFADGKHHWW